MRRFGSPAIEMMSVEVLVRVRGTNHEVEGVVEEPRKVRRSNEVPLNYHPKSVRESCYSQCSDEDGNGSGNEDALTLCGEDSEEEVDQELEEVRSAGVETDGEVGNERVEEGAGEKEGNDGDRVGEDVGTRTVQSVRTLSYEHGAFLWDPCCQYRPYSMI